jgi:hypothetical protein
MSSAGSGHRFYTHAGDWREIPAAEEFELEYRHGDRKKRRVAITAAMRAAGYPANRIERFENCGGAARVVENASSGQFKVRAFYCHDRWCEKCSSPRTLGIADNLVAALGRSPVPGVCVVLTTVHTDDPLPVQVNGLLKNFRKLRETSLWKSAILGGAYFLQMHVADSDGRWHVHVHCVLQCVQHFGKAAWLDALDLSATWFTITGDSSNVHVSQIKDVQHAAREACRYACRPIDDDATDDTDSLAEMMRAIGGRRLCSTIGTWRGMKLNAKPAVDESEIWLDHGRLIDLVWNARRGDQWANRVLDCLWSRTEPKRGPPELFDRVWCDE